MINPDDLEPRVLPSKPVDLQNLSIHELRNYIASLESEIARAREFIAKKEAHKSGVDSLFGGPQASPEFLEDEDP